MTMHDDPKVRLLEHDLRTLAGSHPEDEQVRLALRRQLAVEPRPRPRRRLGMRIAFGLSAAAAAAALALVGLLGVPGASRPAAANAAIIHRALTAVTPPANEILYVKVVGVQNGAQIVAESWQQTSPPYASRAIKGEVGHQGEFSDDGITAFEYDPTSNVIYRQPDSSRPTFADPISQVRQELANGQARVAGTVVIDGTSLYKIDLPRGLVGYFDASGYRARYLDDPQRDGTLVRLRVAAYEYLPMTPSNRGLLSVTAQHPSARILAGASGPTGK